MNLYKAGSISIMAKDDRWKGVAVSMYVMKQTGWIELICGSMFSGKSEELIKRVSRAQFAKEQIAVFKPAIDNRYAEEAVVSHNGRSVMAKPIDHSTDIFNYLDHAH